ncbi:MAG: hypothetical protein JNM40_07225 [Myxococcales bacterium]|nr:hypothetical protein [Myxococcales bacterium]
MSIHLDEETASFDPDARRLCGDPACIGVLAETGRCLLCGRIAEGEEPLTHTSDEDAPDLAASDENADAGSADSADRDAADDAMTDSDGLGERRLCEDPGCIGILNAEGRCSECARTFDLA